MRNTEADKRDKRGSGGADPKATGNPKVRDLDLKRSNPQSQGDSRQAVIKPPDSVSAGPVDKVIELAFNPSREKLREVTIIDRMQGRTFPLIDTMSSLFLDCIKVAAYRQSPKDYQEVFEEVQPPPIVDVMGEYLYRTAQWQKSIAGKNLERATDIALAETEKSAEEEDQYPANRGYED